MDLYSMPSTGGEAVRITTSSGSESPLAFIDASRVIYQTSELTSDLTSRHPSRLTRTYVVDTALPGARPMLYSPVPMGAVAVNADGRILYQDKKGLEDPLRKHERSSGTSDIWMLQDGKYSKLTTFNGHDLTPAWAPGGMG